MALEFEVSGSARLHVLAERIRTVGDKGLGRELATALKKAAEPVEESVREEATRSMPSGYAPILSTSLRFRTALRTGARTASLRLVTYADGKSERRDVPALNRGVLRHPLFGRRKHWYTTRVRPGFFDRGTAEAADRAEAAMLAILDDFAKRLL